MKKKILLIYTGGTIGMIHDPEVDSYVPFDFENISKKVPELNSLDYEITTQSFSPLVDSSDMKPQTWIKLATIVEENYENFDGFLILHGTDTMAYSASALSFMTHNLAKPIVFTGSQLPMNTHRTDGKENLITALEIAASYKNGKALVPEVSIYFQNKLFRANRTTKYTAEGLNAFQSYNYPPLAEAGINITYNTPYIKPTPEHGKFSVSKSMDESIALLKLFPGINSNMIRWVFNAPGVKAVIIETYGSGNAPTYEWLNDIIKDAIERGIIVLNVTQCQAGKVEMGRYKTGLQLLKLGVVSGHDITTEAAVTKLMYLLANSVSKRQIETALNKSLVGEICL